MAYADIYLLDVDEGIDDENKVGYSGSTVKKIYLQGTNTTYNGTAMINSDPIPGVDMEQNDFTRRLTWGDFSGINTPTLTIQGVIDLELYDGEVAEPILSDGFPISVKFLQKIYTSGHVFKYVDIFKDNTYRISSLSGDFPDETVSFIYVKCTGVTIVSNTQIKEGAKVTYTIKLVEVRNDT